MLPYILLPRYFKIAGLLLFVAGYTLAIVARPDFTTVADGVSLLVQCTTLLGLLLIACSRQKVEDEMIRQIRLTSLQYAVVIFVLLRVTYKVTGYITKDESWMPQFQANFLVILYIATFYYQNNVRPWLSSVFTNTGKNEK
jgi:hypothetical protein